MTHSDISSPFAADLLTALQEVQAHKRGEITLKNHPYPTLPAVDVKAIRARLGLTQKEFAATFKFSPSAVRNWEQGIRTPEIPIRAYLMVIAHNPVVVREALPV